MSSDHRCARDAAGRQAWPTGSPFLRGCAWARAGKHPSMAGVQGKCLHLPGAEVEMRCRGSPQGPEGQAAARRTPSSRTPAVGTEVQSPVVPTPVPTARGHLAGAAPWGCRVPGAGGRWLDSLPSFKYLFSGPRPRARGSGNNHSGSVLRQA